MRPTVAIGVAVAVVLVAVAGGLTLGRIARPSPTPQHVVVTFTPAPSPTRVPVDEATLFRQPISAGCATASSVWLVTDGGGILRYDGTSWDLADDTLRSLVAVACASDSAYAVGRVGAFVIVDERSRQIRSTDIALADLFGVTPLDDGALMVGADGTVMILAGGNIQPYASGIDESLRAVVAFSQRSAWAVGDGGITYRLDQRGWNPVGSGQTKTLRAIAARTAGDPIAVGDGGVIVAFSGGAWHAVASGVSADLRDIIVVPQFWIAGRDGTLLTGESLASLRRVDLHTTCDLVSVTAQGLTGDVFVVGAKVGGGGVWLLRRGEVVRHWGGC